MHSCLEGCATSKTHLNAISLVVWNISSFSEKSGMMIVQNFLLARISNLIWFFEAVTQFENVVNYIL